MASKDKRKNRTFTYLLLLIVILAITIGILVYLLVTKTKNNIRCGYNTYLLQGWGECVSCKEPEKCNKYDEYIDFQKCNTDNPTGECKPCGFECPSGKKFGKCPPAPKGIFPYNCCCV
tara:strand:+ start:118 stop:471 length:354 start_codon:yes stop_codon:yes gene_type:complete